MGVCPEGTSECMMKHMPATSPNLGFGKALASGGTAGIVCRQRDAAAAASAPFPMW